MNLHPLIYTLAISAASLLWAAPAAAQDGYPNKPIKLIVPYNPGGSSDLTARFIADMAKDLLGQPVIVENRPGAGGTIGIGSVATSARDGYTLVQVTGSPIVVRPHLATVSYDPRKDFTYQGRYMVTHAPLAVKADSPFKTIQDALAYAKANPGKFRWAVGAPQGGHGDRGHVPRRGCEDHAGPGQWRGRGTVDPDGGIGGGGGGRRLCASPAGRGNTAARGVGAGEGHRASGGADLQ